MMAGSQMTNNNSEPGSEHIMTGDWGQLHRGNTSLIILRIQMSCHTHYEQQSGHNTRYVDINRGCLHV